MTTGAFWSLGRTVLKIIQGKAFEKKSGLRTFKAKKIVISTKQRNIPVEIDGDVFKIERIEVQVLSKAVAVIGKK